MATEPTAGQALGRYQLLMSVAQGGMARVWVARLQGTRGFRKLVAVKTILSGSGVDGAKLDRMLLEEATLAAGIHHPNVASTFELGEQDDLLYLVMEWIDGEGLHTIVRHARARGGMPLLAAVNIVGQVCKGLHAAHEQTDDLGAPLGIVHRDVSPHNILVTYTGVAKLVDFGIAKATERPDDLSDAGELKGKLAYVAPEVVCGEPADRRADIFSLGTVLYLVTTGRHPFKADSAAHTLRKICSPKPVLPPSALVPDYPPELEAAVVKALQKKPQNRFATARDLLDALERAVPGAFEAQAEAHVGEYMKRALGERGAARRQAIAEVIAAADLRGAQVFGTETPEGTSQGSLRAITVDSVADAPLDRTAASTLDSISSRRHGRWGLAVLAGAVTLAAAVAVGVWMGRDPDRGAASPLMTPPASATRTVETVPSASVVAPALTVAPAASAPSLAATTEASEPPARPAESPAVNTLSTTPSTPRQAGAAARPSRARAPRSVSDLKDPYADD